MQGRTAHVRGKLRPCLPANRRKQTGFSLIELLVSIAVVVVLAGIIVPLVSSSKKSALSIKDASHLRGWGMQWYMYNQAEGVVRHWCWGSMPTQDPARYWTWYLVWKAGFATDELKRGRSPMYDYAPSWGYSEFYGFVLAYDPGPGGVVGRTDGGVEYQMRFENVENSGDVPWVANSFNGTRQAHTIRPRLSASSGTYHLVHDGFANVMFLDGHLERADAKRLHGLGVAEAWNESGVLINTADYLVN